MGSSSSGLFSSGFSCGFRFSLSSGRLQGLLLRGSRVRVCLLRGRLLLVRLLRGWLLWCRPELW